MKRFFGALIVALMMASSAQAGVLANYLTFDGTPDTLQDNSRGELVDGGAAEEAGGDGVVNVGDKIFGFMRIDTAIPGGNVLGNDVIAVVFSFQITGTSGAAFTHSPLATADPFSLASLLTGAPNLAARVTDETIALVISHAGTLPDPFLSFVGAATSAAEMALFTDADWSWDMTVGMVAANGDFFHSIVVDNPAVTPPPFLFGSESGGFTVLDNAFGAGFLPVPALRLDTGTFSLHDISLTPISSFVPSGPSPWDIADQASFVVNAVPEPGSMLVWGGMMAFGMVVAARRRYLKSKAA